MKLHTLTLLATSLATTALSACTTPQVIPAQTANATAQTKSYVSDDYHNRHQGYDWAAVETTEQANNSLKVQIRSRIDKKKPTCTFDGIAHPVSTTLYQIRQGDMTLNLTRRYDTQSDKKCQQY